MANIFDYIQWRDLSIEKVEFNEIDNLILARLSYFPLDGVVNGEEEISGECEIEKEEEKHGYYIDVKIQPAQKSKLYVLEITLKIADEIIKNREKMEVI